MAVETKQVPADRLLASINRDYGQLAKVWWTEDQIEVYANGGPPPSDRVNCDDEPTPLGFANTFTRKELAPKLDVLTMQPGFIEATYCTPAIDMPERTQSVTFYVNEAINSIVMPRLRNTLTNFAGRATIKGMAFIYRKSRNSLEWKNGRMIHSYDMETDPLDSSFREWTFAEKLNLADIDSRLKNSDTGKYGWSRKGLENLKLWLLASEAEKYANGTGMKSGAAWTQTYTPEAWLGLDLDNSCGTADPVSVYWYFRKNGKFTTGDADYGGHEKVDLYCISRFGNEAQIVTQMKENTQTNTLKFGDVDAPGKTFASYEERYRRDGNDDGVKERTCNERLLFFLPDAFVSVEECLNAHVDDAAVSGNQRIRDVRGSAKAAIPKLAVQESLMASLIEGVSFGAQVTWTVNPGVPEEYLKQLERGGVKSGQAFPAGVKPMEKNNSFTGLGPAVQAIRMLDTGISADSSANSQPVFGSRQDEFAAQANAGLQAQEATLTRRMEGWLATLDRLAVQICRTLCRHWPEVKKQFPSYEDTNRLRISLAKEYQIHPDEWDADRWKFKARRLAGAMQRQQSVQVNAYLMQVLGPVFPSLNVFFGREIMRGTYGDTLTAQLLDPPKEKAVSQEERAASAVNTAYVTFQVPAVQPMDDPMIHSGFAGKVAEARIRSAMQAGTTTPAEVQGIMAILQYAGSHVARVPEQIGKPAMERLVEMGKAIQSVPVQQPQQPGALTERDKVELSIKAGNLDRLKEDSAAKNQNVQFTQLEKLKKLGMDENMQNATMKNLAVQRAQGYAQLEADLNEPAELQSVA